MRRLVITQNITVDGSIAGRQTFEDLRGCWPTVTDDTTGVADYLNQVAKYVVSSTMTDPRWQHTTVLSGDPVEEVRLFVHPVVQGRGRRLFPDGYQVPRLELLECTPFRSGITLQRYAPA